jgi:hypothetical protein
MRSATVALVCSLAATSPLWGQGIVDPTVSGSTVTASIALSGGIGADLVLSFEGVSGLDLSTLGLSARLVDPNSLALLARLPAGGLVGVPTGFPVLVSVRPTTTSALSFTGVYTLDLHTANLLYMPGTPLRLFAAHDGGAFHDITASMSSGSYRVRGTEGSFSDFLIVTDGRGSDTVIGEQLDRTQALLDDNSAAIASAVLAELDSTLATAQSQISAGAFGDAADTMDGFADLVQEHAGADIPNLWRANNSTVNVAGALRAAAATLELSLRIRAN